MRIVVVGAGNVGTFVAKDLSRRGHDIVVIEQHPETIAVAKQELPEVNWVKGDACELYTLDAAVLSSCDVCVAATGDDEDNLVVSLLAKQEFAVPRVIARVNHPDNEWLFTENWGVDVSVSTPHLILALTEEALTVRSLVRLLQLERGHARLVEATLAPDAPVLGKT